MCGFAGWFDTGPDAGAPPSPTRRRRVLDLLTARGPDAEGEWIAEDGRAGLLHRRLAIVDRAGGAQPMVGPQRGQMLAWNGELFEADARRAALERSGETFRSRSDTEVLARLLGAAPRGRESGVEGADFRAALAPESGQWAIAWIDLERGELLLARDVAGEKPLYYATGDDRIVFASTLDALRALVPIDTEIDGEALSLYLSWGFVPAPLTIFRGASKLAAGQSVVHTRRAASGGAARVRVQETDPVGATDHAATQAVDASRALEDALTASARRRLTHSDEPVGVFLSGGLDSLAIAAVLRDAPGLQTFTVRADDPRYDESGDAARAAKALGIAHTIIAPPAARPDAWRDALLRHGEPFGSTSALAVDAVARAAAPHVRVVLTGDGGDEALGGYPRHVLLRRLARLPALPGWAAPREGARWRRLRRGARLLALSPSDRYAAMYEVFGDHRATIFPGDDGAPARTRIASRWGGAAADDLDAMLRIDRAFELPDSHCVKVDTACMAHGVEARSPWLDRAVVATCDALPVEDRMRRGRTKLALRELLRRRLPAQLADDVLSRPKRGFTAGLDAALSSPDAEELLLGGALALLPGVQPAGARALLEEHRAGRGNHRFRLAVLLSLALFAEAHVR